MLKYFKKENFHEKSTVKTIWRRSIPRWPVHPRTEVYRKMRQEHYKHYDEFIKQLKLLEPPLAKRFIEIMDEQLDTVPIEMSEMFIDGFRLGARMMIEIYQADFSDISE